MKSAQSDLNSLRRSQQLNGWIASLALLLIPACGMAESSDPGEADPGAASAGDTRTTVYPDPALVSVPSAAANEVIVECERHIRTWQIAQSSCTTERDREQLNTLETAFGTYVFKELTTLTEIAITGPERARGIASTSLGFTRDPTVLPILVSNLEDASDQVVANTLFGLAMLGDPNIPISTLEPILNRAPASSGLIRNAAFALVSLAKARTELQPPAPMSKAWNRTMALLLDRPEPTIRAQGASGLGYLRAEASIPRLADLLSGDPESRVRFAAAFALGEMGSKDAAPDLIGGLQDPDSLTAGASRAALTKIFGLDHGPTPEAWMLILR